MIEIRDVRIEDAEDIAAILNPIIAARCYTALDTPVTVEQEREFIRTFPARGIFVVAVDSASNRIAGFQDVSPFADFTHAFDHVGRHRHLRRSRPETEGDCDAGCSQPPSTLPEGRATRSSSHTCGPTTRPGCKLSVPRLPHRRHSRAAGQIDGRYIDEIVIEKLLTGD